MHNRRVCCSYTGTAEVFQSLLCRPTAVHQSTVILDLRSSFILPHFYRIEKGLLSALPSDERRPSRTGTHASASHLTEIKHSTFFDLKLSCLFHLSHFIKFPEERDQLMIVHCSGLKVLLSVGPGSALR